MKVPCGRADDGEVADGGDADLVLAAHDRPADDGAHQATVEAHAAIPGGDDLGGVLKVVARAVEQHIAKTATDDDAEGDADDDAHDVVD